MPPRLLVSLIALAALMSASAVASAEPVQELTRDAASPTVSDGARFAAFMRDGRTLHVLDDGFTREFDVAVPQACPDPAVLEDVGGGQALINCGRKGPFEALGDPFLLDLVSRVWHEPPGAADLLARVRESGDFDGSFTEVGAHWLAGSSDGPLWLEWHTGEFRDGIGIRDGVERVPDLDAVDLFVPLCRPLRSSSRSDFQFDPPYAYQGLTVMRCGSTRRLQLDRNGSKQVGIGYVSWRHEQAVRAYAPDCGSASRAAWAPRRSRSPTQSSRSTRPFPTTRAHIASCEWRCRGVPTSSVRVR